jgi:hypothetical protein
MAETNRRDNYINNKLKKKGKRPLAYNLTDLKRFIRIKIYVIKGIKGLSIGVKTVRNY